MPTDEMNGAAPSGPVAAVDARAMAALHSADGPGRDLAAQMAMAQRDAEQATAYRAFMALFRSIEAVEARGAQQAQRFQHEIGTVIAERDAAVKELEALRCQAPSPPGTAKQGAPTNREQRRAQSSGSGNSDSATTGGPTSGGSPTETQAPSS